MIHILLADDHPVFRAGLRQTLNEQSDIQIVGEATNGDETWVLCQVRQPEVLLLDLRMPGLPTIELVALVHTKYPAVRIVILTAFDDVVHLRTLAQQGIAGYILKDEPPLVLTGAIRAVMRGQVWLSPTLASRMVLGVAAQKSPEMLTHREQKILQLLADGTRTAQIAEALHLGQQTVSNYLSVLYAKLEVANRTAAVARARKRPNLE